MFQWTLALSLYLDQLIKVQMFCVFFCAFFLFFFYWSYANTQSQCLKWVSRDSYFVLLCLMKTKRFFFWNLAEWCKICAFAFDFFFWKYIAICPLMICLVTTDWLELIVNRIDNQPILSHKIVEGRESLL